MLNKAWMRDSKLKLADEVGVDDEVAAERFGPPVSSMEERPGGIGKLNPELLVARCEELEASLTKLVGKINKNTIDRFE